MILKIFVRNSCTTYRALSSLPNVSTTNAIAKIRRDRPSTIEIDGKKLLTDDKYNLSTGIHRLMERRLLEEHSNPLFLLKQRIVNYVHSQYRKKGNRSPLFTICDKEPRVVTLFENFDSLLTPEDHVSRRASDTYYVNADYCLRAHTSAHQHKLVQEGLNAFLVIGDVYRRDEIDKTHYPCFHQVEGVRLYSPDELFNTRPDEDLAILENGERTDAKQELLTEDATKALEIQLKSTLEGLCDVLFGADCQKRWVDAYFPFTHPSFELEKLLQSAGVTDKVGWAFGIGLERIAMVLYGIPDIRLFWSRDSGFLSQFTNKSPNDEIKYAEVSVHPQVIFDLSFYLPSGTEFNDMTSDVYDMIRSVGGDLIEQVELTDEFTNKKKGLRSQTYRIIYRSHEKALTKEEVNVLHKQIESDLKETFGVTLR